MDLELDSIKIIKLYKYIIKTIFSTTIDDRWEVVNSVHAAISAIGDEKDEKLFYDLIMTVRCIGKRNLFREV